MYTFFNLWRGTRGWNLALVGDGDSTGVGRRWDEKCNSEGGRKWKK